MIETELLEKWKRDLRATFPIIGVMRRRTALDALERNCHDPAVIALLAEVSGLPNAAAAERARRILTRSEAQPVVHRKDGSVLLPVPGGKFLAGGPGDDEGGGPFKVDLPAYCLAIAPVTNAQCKHLFDATGHPAPPTGSPINRPTRPTLRRTAVLALPLGACGPGRRARPSRRPGGRA